MTPFTEYLLERFHSSVVRHRAESWRKQPAAAVLPPMWLVDQFNDRMELEMMGIKP